MKSERNYYESAFVKNNSNPTDRFPGNHVKFSSLLTLVEWIDTIYNKFHTRAPYTFEFELPVPPMTKESDPLKDDRIKKSNAAIKTLTKLAPRFMA